MRLVRSEWNLILVRNLTLYYKFSSFSLTWFLSCLSVDRWLNIKHVSFMVEQDLSTEELLKVVNRNLSEILTKENLIALGLHPAGTHFHTFFFLWIWLLLDLAKMASEKKVVVLSPNKLKKSQALSSREAKMSQGKALEETPRADLKWRLLKWEAQILNFLSAGYPLVAKRGWILLGNTFPKENEGGVSVNWTFLCG